MASSTGNPAESADTSGKIARQPLHDAILARLRDMIIEGELPPGTRMNEGQIGAQLGVSRTPLREAIKSLSSEGLVDLVPSRGAVVKRFSPEEIQGMLETLRVLEEFGCTLACANGSDADIAGVRSLHDQMVAAYKRSDRLNYYKLNQQIHSGIVALSGNGSLIEVHTMLQTRLKRIRFVSHEGAENWAKAIDEHEAMIDALERRDADRLAAIVGDHLRQAWVRVQSRIED